MTGRDLYAYLAERDLLDRRLFVRDGQENQFGDRECPREVVAARVVLDPPTPEGQSIAAFSQQHVVLLEGA